MCIQSVMPSSHLILCHPLLLLPSIIPSIRVFSNESVLHIGWSQYWSFSFSTSPSNEYSRLISLGLTGWISLQSKGIPRVFSSTTVQKHLLVFWSTSYFLCQDTELKASGPRCTPSKGLVWIAGPRLVREVTDRCQGPRPVRAKGRLSHLGASLGSD